MASIRCKACGKTYDYRKEGFCPKCGAYNRPPRQEWVDAEGTVHYAGQEKECYERKKREGSPDAELARFALVEVARSNFAQRSLCDLQFAFLRFER